MERAGRRTDHLLPAGDHAQPASADHGELDGSKPRIGCRPVKISAVQARYEHVAGTWRRATPERRLGLIGELELLALQLPAVNPDDPDRGDVVALRAAILALGHRSQHRPGRPGLTPTGRVSCCSTACRGGWSGPSLVSPAAGPAPRPGPGWARRPGSGGRRMPVRVPHHPGHQVGVQGGVDARGVAQHDQSRPARDRWASRSSLPHRGTAGQSRNNGTGRGQASGVDDAPTPDVLGARRAQP